MIDKNHWLAFYYQIREIEKVEPKSLLIIGKGYGIVDDYFRNKDMAITTFDIDKNVKPDIIGDIRNLTSCINNGSYDMVLCAEVLEHLPFSDFDGCLKELYEASKDYVIITLPYNGMFFSATIDWPLLHNKCLNLYIPHKKSLDAGQHQWEIDSNGKTSLSQIKQKLKNMFDVDNEFRYPLFPYIHLFRLRVVK